MHGFYKNYNLLTAVAKENYIHIYMYIVYEYIKPILNLEDLYLQKIIFNRILIELNTNKKKKICTQLYTDNIKGHRLALNQT